MKRMYFLILLIFLLAMFAVSRPVSVVNASTVVYEVNIQGIGRFVNRERLTHGLPALVEIPALDASAKAKCLDMESSNYWAHVSPSGVTPWDFIHQTYTFHYAGENLARDADTSQETVRAWIASPAHEANILGHYTQVGYAVCDGPIHNLVVQHLAS